MNKKNKIICLDYGCFIHQSIFSKLSMPKNSPPSDYICLSSILGCLKKVGVDKGDEIIVAVDFLKSWRKTYELSYKADRKAKREKYPIDWKKEYGKMNFLLDNIEEATNWKVVKCEHCLSGNTRIKTLYGHKNIKNIKEGDKVYSYNFKTKKLEVSTVKNKQITKSKSRYNIYFNGVKHPLKITEEHPVYTTKGWKKVRDLNIGDILYHEYDVRLSNINGKQEVTKFFQKFKTIIKRKRLNTISNGLEIKKIEHIRHKKDFINYNFESQPNNNYFANGCLVHNCEADDIMSVVVRDNKDKEVILITFDHDMFQLWSIGNCKIFSPKTKRYKIKPKNFNVYQVISKMIKKEASDNLTGEILTEEDWENRKICVNLLELPDWVEERIRKELKLKTYGEEEPELLLFNSLKKRYKEIYEKKKLETYEKSKKYYERKAKRKNKKRRKTNEVSKSCKNKRHA